MLPMLFGLFFLLFFIGFVLAFGRSLSTGWKMSRMMHKAFTLAEQEIDRKLSGTASAEQTATPSLVSCEHCGSKIARAAQCPNCGASLS